MRTKFPNKRTKGKCAGLKEIIFAEKDVGLKVSCLNYGNGVIDSFDPNIETFVMRVRFEIGAHTYAYYTNTGRGLASYMFRSLFIGHNIKINEKKKG